MDSVQVGGLQIGFEKQGVGPPLLMLHGGMEDSRVWRRQLDGLSDEFSVIAWDAPGCGRSSDPPADFGLSDYADCLAGFIAGIGMKRVHLLGLSFGGGLAIQFYDRYPDVPMTLVLVSAYAGWAGSLSPEEVQQRLNDGLRQSESPPEQVVEEWLPGLFAASVPSEVAKETAAIMGEFHPVGMRVMLKAFAEADLRHALPRIEVPTLLLYGERDRRSPKNVAGELHEKIPASELVTIPSAGHLLHLEAPDAVNAEIRRFLHAHQG